MAGFNQIARTRFVDVAPGSKIRVEDYATPPNYAAFDAVVLELVPEYGPTRIPMLLLKADHSADPIPIVADGRTNVTVLVSADVLKTDKRDPSALHLRAIPREIYALQFTGGVDSAAKAIAFAAGRIGLSYDRGTDSRTEALVMHSVNGQQRALPGDYVIEDVESGVISFEQGPALYVNYESVDA